MTVPVTTGQTLGQQAAQGTIALPEDVPVRVIFPTFDDIWFIMW